MDRKFILIPALAGGIFLAQSAQQRAEALTAPTATIGQTSNPMMTLVHWGERGGYGYGGGWSRHGYGGDWGRHGYGGEWGGRGGRGYGGGRGDRGGRGYGGGAAVAGVGMAEGGGERAAA